MFHYHLNGQAGTPNPTFKMLDSISGVHNLDPNLTIDGYTVAPMFRYKGGDANVTDWEPWEYGETLTKETNPGDTNDYNTGSPCLGTYDDSVRFNGGEYFDGTTAAAGNMGTDDFVIEAVFEYNDEVSLYTLCGNRIGTDSGWFVYINSNVVKIALDSVEATATATGSVALGDGEWVHVMIFCDRSGSGIIYTNGVAGSAVDLSAVGNIDSTYAMNIGARGAAINRFHSRVSYIAAWKSAGWLDTHLQADLVKERFNKLTGIHPTKAEGTTLPTTQARGSFGFIDKLEDGNTTRKLYNTGKNWMRTVSRLDSNGDEINGYLCEHAVINVMKRSQNLAIWTLVDAADLVADGYTTVDKSTTGWGITASATNGNHGVTRSETVTAAIYTFSTWLKKGDTDWCYLQNNTLSLGAYFDLTNGVIGTEVGSVVDSFMEDWGDDFYRCGISFTGTAAAHDFYIYPAEADNDNTFSGDGINVNLYVWGVQVELEDYMTSYIPTVAAAVTRQRDQLHFKGDDGNLGGVGSDLQGTMSCDVLFGNYDNTIIGEIIVLSDGGSSADRILIRAHTPDYAAALTRATGGNNGAVNGTIDIVDGVIHNIRLTWETNNLNMYVDGVKEGNTDVLADIPDDLDHIDIGVRGASSVMTGVISNVRIYKIPTRK